MAHEKKCYFKADFMKKHDLVFLGVIDTESWRGSAMMRRERRLWMRGIVEEVG